MQCAYSLMGVVFLFFIASIQKGKKEYVISFRKVIKNYLFDFV